MAAVHEASRVWDRIDPRSARESVPTADTLAETFPIDDLRQSPDLLIVELDAKIVGYAHVLWDWTEVTGTHVFLHLGYLTPGARGQGIGRAMLHWAQARILERAATIDPRKRVMLATNVSSTEREADALIRRAGYDAVRRLSDMVLDPVPPFEEEQLPVGVILRPVVPEDYPAIYAAWKDAFAEVWTSTPTSEEDYRMFLADNIHIQRFDPSLWQVAWHNDMVVGLVICRVAGEVGMVPEVAVRPGWRRQGIARALMTYGLNALRKRDVAQVRLFTDAANGQGARGLYERLGFRETKQHIFYRKPLQR